MAEGLMGAWGEEVVKMVNTIKGKCRGAV